jgi:hypothetical protein
VKESSKQTKNYMKIGLFLRMIFTSLTPTHEKDADISWEDTQCKTSANAVNRPFSGGFLRGCAKKSTALLDCQEQKKMRREM